MNAQVYTCSKIGCLQRVYKNSRYCINHTEAVQKRKRKALKRKESMAKKEVDSAAEDAFWNS